jgi:opacity protein-like surface antigen
LSVAYVTAGIDGDLFQFRSEVSGFEEKQRAMMLQVPLMLQFQTGGDRQFYVAAGGKVGIPLQGKYNNTASYSNSGYYPHENALYDTQEFLGFGNFPNKKSDGDLDFKTVFFLSAEAGLKWKLSDGLSLYTGAYMDYGLNKQSITLQPSLVEYNRNNPPAFKVNSILTYIYSSPSYSSSFIYPGKTFYTDKIRPVAAGIKLRLAFSAIRN